MSLEKCFEFAPADVTRVNDLGAGGRHIAGCVFRVLGGLVCQYNICSANPLSYFDERTAFMLDTKASIYTYFSYLLAAAQRKDLESRVSSSAPCHVGRCDLRTLLFRPHGRRLQVYVNVSSSYISM